ncbi:MAG: prepilin-type N-terminal cleavage/methylation domain-containing protein [Phycisphaerales bacterium]|nr:prepilin-type N-terminal cleavage/methylation domain-containing protein [Phycisphaerales bacterium]
MDRVRRRGFTILELLVVIAIIALLIAIIVPGLDKARERGLQTAAMSGMHEVLLAGTAYQSDHHDLLPFTPTFRRGSTPGPDAGPFEGFCPWSFAGKNNDTWWSGKKFDVEAADRPLNPYLGGVAFAAPRSPAIWQPADERRGELPIVRVRGFEDSLQRAWPEATPGVACYDDVGTSFLLNWHWFDAFAINNPATTSTDPLAKLHAGLQKLRLLHDPSRFVWTFDQSGDAAARTTDPKFVWNNAFDDDNRSIMGFADAHTSYVRTAATATATSEYTLVLP